MNSTIITKMASDWRTKSIVCLTFMMGITLASTFWAGLQASRGNISTPSLMIALFSLFAVSPILFKCAVVLLSIWSGKDKIEIIRGHLVVISSKIISIKFSDINNVYVDSEGPNLVLDCGDYNQIIWAQLWEDCPAELEKKLRLAIGLN